MRRLISLALAAGLVGCAAGTGRTLELPTMQVTPDGSVYVMATMREFTYGQLPTPTTVLLKCVEEQESDGVWVTECHPVVTGQEVLEYMASKPEGSAVFKHTREPVHVDAKQWTDEEP